MTALRLLLALVILLAANQCARAAEVIPPHYFVYELVLRLGHEKVSTGTAYKDMGACQAAAVESNRRANSGAHFVCESVIVLK